MARITKDPEERRNQLINIAEELFTTVGYNNTAVSDIVKKASVAQGTFYYYFKSKEDIFLAVFDRCNDNYVCKYNDIINDENTNTINKIKKVIKIESKLIKENQQLIKYLHDSENAGLHQRVIINTIKRYTPVFSTIIQQGIDSNLFNAESPDEIAEFFLVNIKFLFDPGLFQWTAEQCKIKINALSVIMDKILGVEKGSFALQDILED